MTATLAGRRVEAVLFDYGNTLMTFERPDQALDKAYARIRDRLLEAGHPAPEASVLVRDIHDRVEREFSEHQASGDLEEIDLVTASRRAYADLGLHLDAATLDEVLRLEQVAWWEGIRIDVDAVAVLDELRARGLRVGLCSNAPYRVRSMYEQLEHFGLDGHLDAITFSGAVGWRKPSPRIFEAASAALGVPPDRTVMVGDSLRDDVAGALAAGMATVLLERVSPVQTSAPLPGGTARIASLSELLPLLFLTSRV